jgi:hypothetical protein
MWSRSSTVCLTAYVGETTNTNVLITHHIVVVARSQDDCWFLGITQLPVVCQARQLWRLRENKGKRGMGRLGNSHWTERSKGRR